MYLPIVSAAALGLATLSITGVNLAPASSAAGPESLLGHTLWATEAPVATWDPTLRAEALPLEGLGSIAALVTDAEGRPESVTVAVGGLWGFGAQEVSMSAERLHLVPGADGEPRLVLDLSASGAEPPIDGAEL